MSSRGVLCEHVSLYTSVGSQTPVREESTFLVIAVTGVQFFQTELKSVRKDRDAPEKKCSFNLGIFQNGSDLPPGILEVLGHFSAG